MQGGIFKRSIYRKMLDWKADYSDDYALMIEGARRVGKSTIVREFAKNEFKSSLVIDFMKPVPGTIEAFEKYSYDIPMLFEYLQSLYRVDLHGKDSLVAFDEVQMFPPARELIKYLVEETDYRFIETGSLISIKQNVKDIQIPSEEMRVQMNPMSFEEFLEASGDTATMPLLREAYRKREPVGRILHEATMEKFRRYLLVGGMPKAVSTYLSTGSMSKVEDAKRAIISLYRDDMLRIKRGNGVHAGAMFEMMPAMLSRHKKVFSPGMVKPGTAVSDYESSAFWLASSKICNRCVETSDPNPAMNICIDRERYKCYLLDTGLLMTLAFDNGILDRRDVYTAFLKGRLSMNEGMIFENAVAQMLVSAGADLHFHEFRCRADDVNTCEIDFVMARGGKVMPIEVKSASSSSHVSLDRFIEKYRRIVEDPVVIHPRDLRTDGRILFIPVYMTPFLAEHDEEDMPIGLPPQGQGADGRS